MENKGKLLASAFITIIIFAIIYGLHSFYAASFDIHQWNDGVRFSCAFIGGFISLFIGFVTFNSLRE